ncbi:retrovirus-related pol polyprotein from transposon TNT 1-94 [Tanacetum coccineum]
MGRNGSNCFVRLGLRSRGFKASILHLISVLGASWDFLDQIFASIDGYRRRAVGCYGAKKEGCGALATMKGPRYLGEVFLSSLGWKELSHQGISQNFSSPYTPEQNGVAERKNRTLIEAARTILNGSVLSKHFWTDAVRISCYTQNRSIIIKRHDKTSYEIFRERIPDIRYSFVLKAFRVFNTRRQQVEETYHVTFDESMEAIRFTTISVDDIVIDDSFRYPLDEFHQEDDPSRQYQVDSDVSYYIIPHGHSLTKLTKENQVLEVIALNEPHIPHTEDTEGPTDLINTEGTHEQNVQNDQMITQPTHVPSRNYTELSGPITESLVPDVTQSHILNQASTSMLTRSMATKLTASLASECLFADFLPEIEPKKVSEALKHPGWVDAMQEELNQFYRNKVWTLVPLTYGKPTIGSKWVFRNKKDEHVARMEAIMIFLAFATYMNFKVYQMDVKSAFLNGKIKEEVYVKQPLGFENSEFPDYVYDIIFGSTSYKLCKQFEKLMTKKFKISMMGELTYFLGLQIKQDDKGISICQEQYTRNLLKKYEIFDSSLVKTPMVPPNNLGLDLAGKLVNEISYRGMIRSLMYLTATRLDIQFSIVLCARYQSNPKESHLTTVKGILMYLKGTITLGLYYSKCLGFDRKGYSDSDYAGCNIDRKSTLGACQILGEKLVCLSAKKHQSVVMSSAKAEYVAANGCCACIL